MADEEEQELEEEFPPQPIFALAPALVGAGANIPIDYATRAGQSLYAQATSELPYVFEGKNSSLKAFLQAVRDRSSDAGWEDIFDITTGQDNEGNNINRSLLTNWGEITLQHVRDNAVADYIGLQNRNSQVSHQVYQCLKKSIAQEVADRMVTETNNYYIEGVPDGPSFLKTIIQIYSVKTKATTAQIRIKIADAHHLIVEREYNIDSFNNEINGYIQSLSANGEQTQDLFAHMSKAYKLVPDRQFNAYINGKIDGHNDGTAVLTTVELMDLAKGKFDELDDNGEWMKKDHTQEQLVALTTQVQELEERNKNLQRKSKKNTYEKKKGTSTSTTKKKSDKKNKSKNTGKWAWKDIKPRANQSQEKTFEGKTYHWCPHHEMWTLHHPSECRQNRGNSGTSSSSDGTNTLDHVNLHAVYGQEGSFTDE